MVALKDLIGWLNDIFSQLPVVSIKDIFEMSLIAFVIYHVIIWVRGTRAWMLFKGIIVLGAISVLALVLELNTILWIFSKTLSVGIIAVIVVFQPELRRALEQLGRRNILNTIVSSQEDEEDIKRKEGIISDIVDATYAMAAVKTGALLVIEQSERLNEFASTGIEIGAYVTQQLLVNIFEHNTPLHDGAVIIRGSRIVAATCYLPLSDNMTLSKELGTRHRAGVGMSEVSDAIVIIVSEETGNVAVALGGNLVRNVTPEYLKNKLLSIYMPTKKKRKISIWKGWAKDDKEDNE